MASIIKRMEKDDVFQDIFFTTFPNTQFHSTRVTHNWNFVRTVKRLMGATSCLFTDVSGDLENKIPYEFVTTIKGNMAEISIDRLRSKMRLVEGEDSQD